MPSISDQSTVDEIARIFRANGRNKEQALLDVGYKASYARSKGMKLYENKALIKAIGDLDAIDAEQARYDYDIAMAEINGLIDSLKDDKGVVIPANKKLLLAAIREKNDITGLRQHIQIVKTEPDIAIDAITREELDIAAKRIKLRKANTG